MINIQSMIEMNISNFVTILVVILIIIIGYKKRNKDLVTMLGIAGTFIGILITLFSFNESNITSSIPSLIGGLKTAFITSVAGIFAAIILTFTEKKEAVKSDKEILQEICNNLKEINKFNYASIDNEEKKLDLLTQIHTYNNSFLIKQDELKTEISLNNKDFITSFDNFAEKMAKANSEELIKSIQKVMEDFNSKINNQLGQSFSELTNAIDNLLKWQEEYKNNIILSTEALNLSSESLDKSSKGFEITLEKSEKFINITEQLGNNLDTLDSSLGILKSGLNEFDGIAKNTKDMSESMIKSIDLLTDNFVSKADIIVAQSSDQIKIMNESFKVQSNDLNTIHKDILSSLKQNVEENNRRISEQLEKIGNELEKQVILLDGELGEALNKSLGSLGKELTSITQKFTNQLQDLNNILNTVNINR